MALDDSFEQALLAIFGDRVSTVRDVLDQHGRGKSYHAGMPPQMVVFARSTEEVSRLAALCTAAGVPIIPFGAGTSLEGNVSAVHGGVSLDLTHMNAIFRIGANFDPGVIWADLDFIRKTWDGPLVIKGILDPEDVRNAVALGADGIVVSNHGGRQLDGVLSTTKALPPIADAVAGQTVIPADGGVRSGLDVLRMLALGANGVLLGRAWAYALGARGKAGVAHLLRLVEAELRAGMALTGVRDIASISSANLA